MGFAIVQSCDNCHRSLIVPTMTWGDVLAFCQTASQRGLTFLAEGVAADSPAVIYCPECDARKPLDRGVVRVR